MHVALAIPNLCGGGAERTIARLARGLLERGHKVDLVIFSIGTGAANKLPKGARLILLESEHEGWLQDRLLVARAFGLRAACSVSSTLIGQSRRFAKYLDQENPDCILPSLPKMKVATFLASRIASRNQLIVPIVHSSLSRRGRKYKYLYSIMFPTAERVISVSDGISGELVRELGLAPRLVQRIYNPVVNCQMETLAGVWTDHPWLRDDGQPIVLAAGRLARVKDFPTLLHAFALVVRNRPARLILLGDGRWRSRLEKLARNLGVADSVWFGGWVDNPYPFMQKASVFVLSSRYEGLGNVLIEALAVGCPCVSTNCPYGPAEILENGRFGPLVRVGHAKGLARAIEQVLDSPPKKEDLRARAQQFGFGKAIAHYERMLLDVVGKRQAGAGAHEAV